MVRVWAFVFACLLPALAQAQMPDVSQMSGVPLPIGDLPNGTVSIRVVRGDLSNNVTNHPVELHGGGQVWKATTDAEGRAQFASTRPGTSVHAVTTVDGQSIESQEFAVPAEGGIRVVLVAQAGGTAQAGGGPSSAPAAPGTLSIGGQSRIIVEPVDGAIDVYYVFEFVHEGPGPVETEPIVFRLPDDATGATVLQGSEGHARAEGRIVTVTGPFPAGRTPVQFAYQIRYSGSRVDFAQTLPVGLASTAVIVQKIGDVAFTSPQTPNQSPLSQGAATYTMGNGPGIPAGGTLQVSLSGLPHRSPWPRNLALGLAVLIVGVGIWIATADGDVVEPHRQRLEARREHLFGELVRLEQQHRAGRGDPARYKAKRRDLVDQLERVYADLEALAPA